MYSLVLLRRTFTHGVSCRIPSDLSRSCGYFPTAESNASVRITQCNVRASINKIGLNHAFISGYVSWTTSSFPIRSYYTTSPNWPRRSFVCSGKPGGRRPSGRGFQIVNHESCSSLGLTIHSLNCKIQFCQQLLQRFLSTDTGPGIPKQTLIMEGTIDRFNGVRIDMEEQVRRSETLTAEGKWNLKESLLRTLSYYQAENKPSVWLEIPAQCGHIIPIAAEVGFCFHHAEKNHVMMYQWLGEGENRIPEYATHQVGVSGFVLDQERQQVLMVQDRHRIARWKFPGGYSKLGEDFSETAIREVFEETGIRTEFKSILAFRQQHQMPYSFNRSDIYVVCRLEPVTFDLTVCSTELLDAKWIPLKELFTSRVHTGLTLHVAGLAKQGLEKGFQNVDIAMSELPSVYKGMTYKLFSRPAS